MLGFGEVGKRVMAVLPAESALPVAAGLGFGEQSVVVVDPDGTVAQRTRHTHGALAVVGPYAGRQSEDSVVRLRECAMLSYPPLSDAVLQHQTVVDQRAIGR